MWRAQSDVAGTWSFKMSLISAHLEKTALWAFFFFFSEVGVFASHCSSLEKSGHLFPSNWCLFPSDGRFFLSHFIKWAFFHEVGVFFLKNEVGRI